MAQHGYLGDGYGTHGEFDPDRDERDRDRDHDRERSWRSERGMMFGGRDRNRFDADEWFGGRERGEDRESSHYGREHGFGGFQGDYSRGGRDQGGFGGRGDWERGRQSFASHQDDHYRSWRDRQMQALDSDYADYCREREQQFHSDFDDWRRQRRGNPEPLQPGRTQSGQSLDPSGMTQAENEANEAPTSEADALSTATLGTSGGRSRR
jgi:hypothetical protein